MRVFVPMWRTRASFAGTFSLLFAAVLAAVLAACAKTGMNTSPSPGGGGINPVPAPRTDVVSHRNDASRTGQNLKESILTLTNVNPSRFRLQRFLTPDGTVEADPVHLS